MVTAEEGTAQLGTDYQALNERIEFVPGQTEAYTRLNIVNDDVVEDNENLLLKMTQAENGVIGTLGETTISIANDDSK